ncbi:hypothetical protein PN463_09555 [Dolichospermum circinale CS-537/03]|nr:hypothetical protein [Dolichospermum circinale CS-537/03]
MLNKLSRRAGATPRGQGTGKSFNCLEEDIIRLNSNLLPNAENAVVDIRKLRDYSLNPNHSTGKDKARLFSSILGMTAENAE